MTTQDRFRRALFHTPVWLSGRLGPGTRSPIVRGDLVADACTMDEFLSGGPPERLTPRRQSRAVAVMVVLAVLAGGVLAAQRARSRPERRASATASVIPAPVGTVRIAAMPPRGCTAREVTRLVEVFVEAFNSGNRVSLSRLWAQEGDGFD